MAFIYLHLLSTLGESTSQLLLYINKSSGNKLIESFLDLTLPFLTRRLVTFFTIAKGNQTLANLFAPLVETQSPFNCDRTNSLHPTDVTWI